MPCGGTRRPADAGVVAREIARIREAASERARHAEIERAEAQIQSEEDRKRRQIWIRSISAIAFVLAVGAAFSIWLALRAREAESMASQQLALTQIAERTAREESNRARESERLANDRETQERLARKEAEQQKREAKEQASSALAVKDFVCDVLIGSEPKKNATPQEIEIHRTMTRRNLDYAVRRLDETFDGKPELEAGIRNTIGLMYDKIDAKPEAEVQLQRSMEIYEQALGRENTITFHAVNTLAMFYVESERFEEAKPLLLRSLEGFENDQGVGGALAMHACNQLIRVLQSQKRYSEAIECHKRILKISERVFGVNSDESLNRRLDLGRGYVLASQFAEAEREFRDVYSLGIQYYGHESALVATATMDVVECLQKQGNIDEILKFLEGDVQRLKSKLGPDHDRTISTQKQLAYKYSAAKKYGQSIQIYQVLLRTPKLTKLDTCGCLLHMGNDYKSAGKVDEAIRNLEQGEEIRRTFGKVPFYRDYAHTSLEVAYFAKDRPDKIAKLLQNRLQELRPTFPPNGDELGNELAMSGRKLLKYRQYRVA